MPHECTNCGRVFPDGSKEMLSGCPNCSGNKFQFRPSSQEPESGTQPKPELSGSHSQSRSDQQTHSGTGSQPDTQRSSSDADPVPKPDTTAYDGVGAESHPTANTSVGEDQTQTQTHQSNSDSNFDPWPHTNATEDSEANNADTRYTDHSHVGDSHTEETRTENSIESSDHLASNTTNSEEDSTLHPSEGDDEDDAQASARGNIVSPEELAATESSSDAKPHTQQEASASPGKSELSSRNYSQMSADTSQPSSESSPSADDDGPGLSDLRTELNQQFESIRIVAPGQYELNLMELYDRSEYIISLQEDGRYIIEVPNAGDGLSDDTN
jgi:Zn-ribbon containing protein